MSSLPPTFKLIEEFGKKTATYMHNASKGVDDEPVIESGGKRQIMRITTLKTDAIAVMLRVAAVVLVGPVIFGIVRHFTLPSGSIETAKDAPSVNEKPA